MANFLSYLLIASISIAANKTDIFCPCIYNNGKSTLSLKSVKSFHDFNICSTAQKTIGECAEKISIYRKSQSQESIKEEEIVRDAVEINMLFQMAASNYCPRPKDWDFTFE